MQTTNISKRALSMNGLDLLTVHPEKSTVTHACFEYLKSVTLPTFSNLVLEQ